MKLKNKGKVHPSPSSSSSSCSNIASVNGGVSVGGVGAGGDCLSVLKLLPAAIFTLVVVLPLDDREVLAYLIMRSMKSTAAAEVNSSGSSFSPKKPSKKTASGGGSGLCCDCFDCYTSFWFRWDSSPNRELIHQAIEAFEDHLTTGETEKNKKNAKSKRRDKMSRRFNANGVTRPDSTPGRPDSAALEEESSVCSASSVVSDVPVDSPCSAEVKEVGNVTDVGDVTPPCVEEDELDRTAVSSSATMMNNHKGLARKVLPDVLGLFNSRLWSLLSPNV